MLVLLIGIVSLPLRADMSDVLRAKLPKQHGAERLKTLVQLQRLSADSLDLPYQIRCLNELIAEAMRQNDEQLMAASMLERAVLFYNCDLTDSIFAHVPADMEVLKRNRQWDRLYELWTHLVNSYIFSEQNNIALREVKLMFDDAKAHNNTYGMGMAYFTMGNVYSNMHNFGECVGAYRKGLDLLLALEPVPIAVTDLYSYYGDVLNDMKDYDALQRLTEEWRKVLEKHIDPRVNVPQIHDVHWSYYYLACVQTALGQNRLDRAAEALDKVYELLPPDGDYIGMAWLYYSAELSIRRGDYRRALELNTRRLVYGDEENIANHIMVLNQRADIMEHLGRYQVANEFYHRIIHAKDSLNNAATRNQLNEMNTLFQVGEKEREVERLERERERVRFRTLLWGGGLALLALLVFGIFRWRAALRLKKAHDELLVAYDQLEATTTAKERIESDLRIARDIQMGMVPHTFPERPDLDLYASMTPAKEVGGDLYDYLILGDQLYFCLGDVSGKGVPASLFMAMARNMFHVLAQQQLQPADIATRLNHTLAEDNEAGMFVTMFIGLADLQTGHLAFCNAGHNPPVLLSADGHDAEFVEMIPNAPIGLWPDLDYEGEEIADITGRPLFVYTDGLNEAENLQQEQFTDERLLELLQETPFQSARQTIDMLREAVEQHRNGAEPNDDLTMLCLKTNKKTIT